MIHVGFPLYDSTGRYSKYEAVALLSLLSNTSEKLTVHIIHDDSVSSYNKDRLKKICESFRQEIVFHKVQPEDFSELEHLVKSYTIGTLFRLKLPEIIDESVPKILFLDADLLVNTDIKSIWEIDLNDYYVAACHDIGLIGSGMVLSDGLVPEEKYYNAGVAVFNLEKIRKDFDLFHDCTNYLNKHPNSKFADQDATNYLFLNHVYYLDPKYNMMTVKKKGGKLPLEDGIYHFAGDYCNPVDMEPFDELFYHYLYMVNDEKWLTEYYTNYIQADNKQLIICQAFIQRIIDKYEKKIYWGANSVCLDAVTEVVKPDKGKDYIVDSNSKLHNSDVGGMTVYSPKKLFDEKKEDCVVIVVSQGAYSAIKSDLESHGFVENKDFFDGLFLLSQSKGKRMAAY